MTIEERLENMERELGRQKRRNRWLLGTILLVVGGLIASWVFETTAVRARAQAEGKVKEIRASAFLLEDEKGILRASLKVDKDSSYLVLADENGKVRARLGVTEDGPSLRLYDQNGKDSAALIAPKGPAIGGPCLALWDDNFKLRVWLAAIKANPRLTLKDENGKVRVRLDVTKDGPRLAMWDETGAWDGKPRAIMGVPKEGPGLSLCDEKGKVIWSAIK